MPRIEIDGVSFAFEESGGAPSPGQDRRKSGEPSPGAPQTGPETGREGGGDVVAFLNGIAMSIPHWKPLLPWFEDRWPCLLHDMRGQLLSDRPDGEYSLELHARDFASLLDLRGYSRAHVVGTSYGAEVAMTFALEYPERCASLVLVDGVSETDPLLDAAVDSWKRAAQTDPVTFYRCIVPWNYSAEYIGANAETIARREAAVAALPPDYFSAFVRLCDAFSRIDLTERLSGIRCPALVMVGGRDILKHAGFAKTIVRNIPGSRFLVVPGAGHAAVIERPDFIAARARRFIDETAARERGAGT